jgi:hypothetical protein
MGLLTDLSGYPHDLLILAPAFGHRQGLER